MPGVSEKPLLQETQFPGMLVTGNPVSGKLLESATQVPNRGSEMGMEEFFNTPEHSQKFKSAGCPAKAAYTYSTRVGRKRTERREGWALRER